MAVVIKTVIGTGTDVEIVVGLAAVVVLAAVKLAGHENEKSETKVAV